MRLAILRSLLLPPPSTQTPSPGTDTKAAPPTDAEVDAWLPGVAGDCVGYVAADLQALVREAIVAALTRAYHRRQCEEEQGGKDGMREPAITEAALRGAMERVGASVLRGKGLEVPHVPWSAIGACVGSAFVVGFCCVGLAC